MWKNLRGGSEAADNELWEEVGKVLDSEMSSVEDVRFDLEKSEKGAVCQTINNCMEVSHRDPVLKGAIRKNELSGKLMLSANSPIRPLHSAAKAVRMR